MTTHPEAADAAPSSPCPASSQPVPPQSPRRPGSPAPPQRTAPAAPAQGSDGFHRLHPLTPFLHGWLIVVAFGASVGRNLAADVTARAVGLTLLFLIPTAGLYGYLAWRFTRYRIERDGLRLDSGIFVRRTRYVRLNRLQSVDIVQPLVARMIGLAVLRLDLAGQERPEHRERLDGDSDSGSDLRYLSLGHAQRLRAELLVASVGPQIGPIEVDPGQLAQVPPGRLVAAIALSPVPWLVVFGVAAVAVPSLLTGTAAGAFGAVPLLALLWHRTVRAFANSYPYQLSESPNGLRIDSGLLQRSHATIPPGRVQAISIREPLLWRPFGWADVRMNVAGSGPAVLLPVAPRDKAAEVVCALLGGVDVRAVALTRPPRRAALLAPLHRRVLACGADDHIFVVRRGLLLRQTDLIPHGKVQSIRLVAGPLSRRLHLATLHLDTTGGPVRIRAALRDADEAERLVAEQARRSRLARRASG